MDKTKNKRFDKLMERSQEQVQRGKHKEGLDTLEEAAKLLEKEKDTSAESWAWIYDGQRYSLFELKRFDEAMDVCRKAISHLEKTTQWAYLSEHSHIRGTLRATHNMLAWLLCERAKNLKDAEVALDHIERCYKAVSPIDGTTLQEFDETRAMVLLKMIEFSDDPAPYKTQLNVVLLKMVRQENRDLDNNPTLQALIKTEEFEAYKREDPQSTLTQAPEGETALEALERYKRALEFAEKIDMDIAEWYELSVDDSLSIIQLDKFEKELNITFPPALKQFVLDHGNFTAGSSDRYFSVMSEWNKEKNPCSGLVDYINHSWGGRPEFEEFYEPAQLDHLNQNYFVFAMRYVNDDCHEYSFFDREGNYGSIFFCQDDFGEFQDDLDPMLTKSTATMTFDQLVSHQMTRHIELLMEQLNDA